MKNLTGLSHINHPIVEQATSLKQIVAGELKYAYVHPSLTPDIAPLLFGSPSIALSSAKFHI
jgi:hypothetical protein